MESFTLEVIGFIRDSSFKEKFGVPRQAGLIPSARAIIQITKNASTLAAIQGLEENTHLWVNFIFHLVPEKIRATSVRPPRLLGKKLGVWATRSPHRPNRLGLSVVKLERIEITAKDIEITISNHDLVEGTPIVDIRPYVPYSDRVKRARGRWASEMQSWPRLKVEFSPEAKVFLSQRKLLKQLILEVLREDPRPSIQKDKSKIFGILLDNVNVKFQVMKGTALVLNVESID